MTIQEFYKHLQNLSNKDSKGNAFTIDMLNIEVKITVINKFQEYVKLAQNAAISQNKELADVIFDMQNLSSFVKLEDLIITNQGTLAGVSVCYADYPRDFGYSISFIADNKPGDIKPYSQISRYRRNTLCNPDDKPLAFEGDGRYEFIPNDVSIVGLTYLRMPAEPYYDWCFGPGDLEIFMPVGSYVRCKTGKVNHFRLYNANGTVLESEVSRSDFDEAVIYYSKTVELDWPSTSHEQLANDVLQKLAVNLRSPEMVQYTQSKEQ